METKKASVLYHLKLNPCYLESLRSLECQENKQSELLPTNTLEKINNKSAENFDPQKVCYREIKEYQSCRDFWDKICTFRKKHHIKPYIPGVEEQRTIRKTFKTTKNIDKIYEMILENNKNSTKQEK